MAFPSDCSIYFDSSDNSFFIYTTDSTVISFDFYDGDMSTNGGWHGTSGFTSSGSYGGVSYAHRSTWLFCSNYPTLPTLQGRARVDYTGNWTYSETLNNPAYSYKPGSPTYRSKSYSGTTVTVNFTAGSMATSTELYWSTSSVTPSSSVEYDETTTSSTQISVNLGYDTTYFIWIRSRNSQGTSSWVSCGSITIPTPVPAPSTPSFSSMSATDSAITVTYTKGTYATSTELYYAFSYTAPTSGSSADATSTGTSITLTASYGRLYYLWIRSRNATGTSSWVYCGSIIAAAKPTSFSWSFTITSGGQVYSYTQSGSTITAKIMPYTDWRNLVDKINKWRVYKGLATTTFTTVSTNTSFTKEIVNEAINALNPIISTSISTLSSGNSISASLLNTIVSRMNAIT